MSTAGNVHQLQLDLQNELITANQLLRLMYKNFIIIYLYLKQINHFASLFVLI